MVTIKSQREIALMRQTCRLAAETLKYAETLVVPGISTEEINRLVHQYIVERGATPSPLNYHGFPKSLCTSLNDVICHGIPSEKDILKNGDIINLDITTYLGGFHGDTNATFFVGNVKPEVSTFVDVAYEAMKRGIAAVYPGARLYDIGYTIEEFVTKKGYSVVHEYCGHGIGREFHEDPQVLHYGDPKEKLVLKPGMIFTIEPMINMGKRHCYVLPDKWTVKTKDGSLSAQFEHTILVTETGYEILTILPESSH